MAQGDVKVFSDALTKLMSADWDATDDIKVFVCTDATVPAIADADPVKLDYTEVATTANYPAGGTSIGQLQNCFSETGNVLKFDSDTNMNWTAHASGAADAYYAIIYNDTQAAPEADPCIAFVDLGGPVNMSADDLLITWDASGIFTITNS